MSEPVFKLQLVYPDGTLVTFEAGSPFERKLVESCVVAIAKQGVGVFRTTTQVRAAIVKGITEVLTDLKRQSIPLAYSQRTR